MNLVSYILINMPSMMKLLGFFFFHKSISKHEHDMKMVACALIFSERLKQFFL